MRPLVPTAVGAGLLLAAVFGQNLFGRELNEFFLLRPGIDKVLHLVEYAAVFGVVWWLTRPFVREPSAHLAATFIVGIGLSIADELVQSFAPGRSVELNDLLADWSGLTLGWVLVARPRPAISLPAMLTALGVAGLIVYDTHVRLIDYSRALQHERRYEFAEAREHYLRALAKGMTTAAVYNELAWVSVEGRAGPPDEAVRYASLAYAAEPDNPDILDTYGWALHHAGRSQEALPLLEAAFARKPDMFCIHYHLGQAYVAVGQTERAAGHFRAQVSLNGTREAALAASALADLAGRTPGP